VKVNLDHIWWSSSSSFRPCHINLEVGAPPNGLGGEVTPAIVVEELESFFFAVPVGAKWSLSNVHLKKEYTK